MKKLNILLSIAIISMLCSCSLWDNRKQLIDLALHGSKPVEAPIVPVAPIVPEEKTIVDVLRTFSDVNHAPKVDNFSKIIVRTENYRESAVFQIRHGYGLLETHSFKRDLKSFTVSWNIYENEKSVLKSSDAFRYSDFENLSLNSLRANGINIFDEAFNRD